MVQLVAGLTSAFFMLVVLIVFLTVASKSKERKDYEPIKKKWYKARRFYATTLITLLVLALLGSLRQLPYDKPVYSEGVDPIIVDAEAMQFGFALSQTEFKVGEPVEFHVTSKDVNHGFGIYDEDLTLLAQTQAMPEYTNKVFITFTEPGEYQILCLEYCGLGHHMMKSKITVTE